MTEVTLKEARDSAERAYLYRLLSECCGNMNRASRIAGVTRWTIYRLLRVHHIPVAHRKYVRRA